jgi:hypothetical protein
MNLLECTVQSWSHLRQLFEANFHATYSRPGHEDDLFACVQKPDEHLWDFIHRFSEIRNTIPDMSEDRVIVAFKQGCKDERTTEKLATKNLKTVAELYKILDTMAKAANTRARMHDQSDAEDNKKNKDKKRKTGEAEVLVMGKGKAPPRQQGKPKDLPVYCPIHHSTKHSFVDCLVYKKRKQEEEQACRPEGLIRQEPPKRRADPHNDDYPTALGENEIAIICGGTATPASKTKLK